MRHGDFLTVVTAVDDPVFFTEPLVRCQNWFIDPGQQVSQFYCEYVTDSKCRNLRPRRRRSASSTATAGVSSAACSPLRRAWRGRSGRFRRGRPNDASPMCGRQAW